MQKEIIETHSAEETFALGQRIGREALPGQVYTLIGDLGVGKTVFTQGVADGLGITEPVNSPTFTIVQIYEEGRMPFYHLMSIVLAMLRRWRRLAMRIVLRGRTLPDRVGESDRRDPAGTLQAGDHRKGSGERL